LVAHLGRANLPTHYFFSMHSFRVVGGSVSESLAGTAAVDEVMKIGGKAFGTDGNGLHRRNHQRRHHRQAAAIGRSVCMTPRTSCRCRRNLSERTGRADAGDPSTAEESLGDSASGRAHGVCKTQA